MSEFPPNLSIRPLTIDDIEQVEALEKQCFSEEERASLEKIKYRLTVCPELCCGLFVRDYEYRYNSINLPEVADELEKEHKESTEESDDLPSKSSVTKETLVGHIIATKTFNARITNECMDLPSKDSPSSGHIEGSRFIGIHSLAVDAKWRGKKLATLLLHDYIQRLSNQDLGDKIVIIAHEELIPFYENIGFKSTGKSKCNFGGVTWYDLYIDLRSEDDLE